MHLLNLLLVSGLHLLSLLRMPLLHRLTLRVAGMLLLQALIFLRLLLRELLMLLVHLVSKFLLLLGIFLVELGIARVWRLGHLMRRKLGGMGGPGNVVAGASLIRRWFVRSPRFSGLHNSRPFKVSGFLSSGDWRFALIH